MTVAQRIYISQSVQRHLTVVHLVAFPYLYWSFTRNPAALVYYPILCLDSARGLYCEIRANGTNSYLSIGSAVVRPGCRIHARSFISLLCMKEMNLRNCEYSSNEWPWNSGYNARSLKSCVAAVSRKQRVRSLPRSPRSAKQSSNSRMSWEQYCSTVPGTAA